MPDVRLTSVKHIAQQVRGEHLRISEALDFLADICGSLAAGTVEITNNIISPSQDTGWVRADTPDRTRTVNDSLQVVIGADFPSPFPVPLNVVGSNTRTGTIAMYGVSAVTSEHAAFLSGLRSRGTLEAKTAVASGDAASGFSGLAWDGTNWVGISEMIHRVDVFGGVNNISGMVQWRVGPGSGGSFVDIMRLYSDGLYVGGVPRRPTLKIEIENNTNSHAEILTLALRRSRADGTAPNAGFGTGLGFYLEGNTDGSDVLAGWIAASWELNQTDNTTTRDSVVRIVTMESNVVQESARWGSVGHLYQSMLDTTWIYKDVGAFKTWNRYVFGTNTPMYDIIFHGRGTFASPSAVVTGEIIWDREARAYDGVPAARGVYLERLYIDNYVGNDNLSASWLIYLRPTGAAAAVQIALHITGQRYVGINRQDGVPQCRLHVNDDTQLIVQWDTYSSDALGVNQYFRKARGSQGSPATVASGDGIAYLAPMAHDGTTYRQVGQISFEVDTRTGTDNLSGRIRFYTRPDGAAAALTERLQITKDGNFQTFGGYFEMQERTDPAAPAGNTGRLYVRDNGAGKTQLVIRFPTGAIQVIATEP